MQCADSGLHVRCHHLTVLTTAWSPPVSPMRLLDDMRRTQAEDCFAAAGIVEPIKGGVEVGLRLGLGKAEEDRHYTAAENIVRKRLEVEVQAEENAERTQRREV